MKKSVVLLLLLLLLIGGMSLVSAENTNSVLIEFKDGVCYVNRISDNADSEIYVSIPQPEEPVHTLKIGEGIESIFIYASGGAKTIEVQDVYIPSSLSEISYDYCEKYYVDENNPYFCAVDGVLFSKDKKTLESYGLLRANEEYTIPNGTKTIGNAVNFGVNIKRLVFPESVIEINNPFARCINLEEIIFSEKIEAIDVSGLKDTPWYNNRNMIMIGNDLLIGPCNDSVLETPKGCVAIAENAFSNQTFEKVVIGDSVKRIDRNAFKGSNIGELFIGCRIETIENGAFGEMNSNAKWIEEIYLPNSLKKMDGAFFFAKVRELHLPNEYNGRCPSIFNLSKIYLNSESETAAISSEQGLLVFDNKTGNPILPTGENASYILKRIGEMNLPNNKFLSSEVGENIVFNDKKPFIFMYDLYVPLRYMCEIYGIDIYWNSELGIAEVGERTGIETAKENTAVFGNENLVVYNGKRLKPRHSALLELYYNEDYVAGSEHSSINIDGTIYVPISDFVEGTGIGTLYNHNMSPINTLIIETKTVEITN